MLILTLTEFKGEEDCVSQNKPLVQLKQLSRELPRLGCYLAARLEITLEEEMCLTMEDM